MRGPALRSDINSDCATKDTRPSVPYYPPSSQSSAKTAPNRVVPPSDEVVQALPVVTVETSSHGNKAFVMVLMAVFAIVTIVATIVTCSL